MQVTIDFVNKRIKELDRLRLTTSLNTSKASLEAHLEMAKELEILEELKEKIDPSQEWNRGGDLKIPTGYIPEYMNQTEFKVYGGKESGAKYDNEPKMTVKPGCPNYRIGDLVYVSGVVNDFGVIQHISYIPSCPYYEVNHKGDIYVCNPNIFRYATKEEIEKYKKDNPSIKIND